MACVIFLGIIFVCFDRINLDTLTLDSNEEIFSFTFRGFFFFFCALVYSYKYLVTEAVNHLKFPVPSPVLSCGLK